MNKRSASSAADGVQGPANGGSAGGSIASARTASLREAGARAAELASNPIARSMLAAGLVSAAAALAANRRVRKTVDEASRDALDVAEAAAESAAAVGASMVLAATDAVRRLLAREESEAGEGRSVEVSLGSGLGAPLSEAEGRERLDRYVRSRPMESWAGPVAGAGELEKRMGVPRSTLNEWRRRGSAIGLLRGERKHYFPEEQFVDGRPVAGLARISGIAGHPRAAWLWLRQPHARFEMQTPLDVLKRGSVDSVVDAARRDFS